MSDSLDSPRIVAATGSAASRRLGALGHAMQRAMVQAVQACLSEGITDPEIIRARQLAAKDAVKHAALSR